MDDEKREVEIKESDKIANKWINIIMIAYIPIGFLVTRVIKVFAISNIYENYYVLLSGNLLWGPGIGIFLIGLIINELIYFWKCKENKKVIIQIFLLCCVCWGMYIWIPYSEIYNNYKDLHYVMENTYCEDVQEVKDVYVNVITGKLTTKTLYIETSNFKFIVNDNIVNEDNYDSFKYKYSKVKKVRIKYLPNSNLLLSIKPIEE